MPEQKLIVSPLTREDVKQLIKEELEKEKEIKVYNLFNGGEIPESITKAEADEIVKKYLNGYLLDYNRAIFVVAIYKKDSSSGEMYLGLVNNEHVSDAGSALNFIDNGDGTCEVELLEE